MPWEYTVYIPNDPRAVRICRHTLRDILTTHHLPALIEPAELLASELLGNAIRHTKGPAALKLRQAGPSFRLGAWDSDPTPPTTAPQGDESGRRPAPRTGLRRRLGLVPGQRLGRQVRLVRTRSPAQLT